MNTLKVQHVSKVYSNGVEALRDINITISNGIFGLLGPNGAGKSSLIRILTTLQAPSHGTVFFNDVDITQNPEFIRRNLGYLPQEFGVYPNISAYDLLEHLSILKGISNGKSRDEQILSLLELTNLLDYRKRNVSTFSGGMRQRFGIAQALLGDPKVIIVDEPTAGLDPQERNRFHNLLSEIGENVIVILSTHIVEDVRNVCVDMAVLDEGSIIIHGEPKTLISELKGKIWQKNIRKNEFEMYNENFDVLSSQLHMGEIRLRVLESSLPSSGFEMVKPGIADVYFSNLKSNVKSLK